MAIKLELKIKSIIKNTILTVLATFLWLPLLNGLKIQKYLTVLPVQLGHQNHLCKHTIMSTSRIIPKYSIPTE